jgi:uncharacterized protein
MNPGGENTNRKTILIILSISIVIVLFAAQTYATSIATARATSTSGGLTGTGGDPVITVQGTGTVQVQPDRGIVTIGVVTSASTAQIAVQNNANTSNAVISALNGIGINNSEIQTIYYNVYPQSTCCSGTPNITGYQVTNEFQVTVIASGATVTQLGQDVGQAIDTASSAGANQIYGVEFTASSSATQQSQETALQQAALDASQQAHTIASALGVTITGVVSATTLSPGYVEPVYSEFAVSASPTPIQPPQSLTVTASVEVTFSIS